MTRALYGFGLFLVAGIAAAFGDPAAEVRAALNALGRSSYTWETTVRQRSSGDAASLSLQPNASLEVTGKTEVDGYIEITLLPSKQTLDAPVTAIFRSGDVVGHTPLGWLRRTEIREAQGAQRNRVVTFEGKSLPLSRCLAAALRVTAMQVPLEEALDLVADVKSYRETDGYLFGELREGAIERLWREPRAKSAPEIQGSVIFKIRDNVLSEYHVMLAIGFPSSRNQAVAWSVMQWTTRFRGHGSTTVTPPDTVIAKLKE